MGACAGQGDRDKCSEAQHLNILKTENIKCKPKLGGKMELIWDVYLAEKVAYQRKN